MRILWISFLLSGSITCAPQFSYGGVEYRPPLWYGALDPQQEPYLPLYHYPSGQASSVGGYSPPEFYYSSGPSSAGGVGSGSNSGVQQGSHHGAPGDGSSLQVGEESYTSSTDPGEDEPEFTPVNEQDVVYSKKSRSRYSRKQYRVATFNYDPTRSEVIQPPAFPHQGQKVGHQGVDPLKKS